MMTRRAVQPGLFNPWVIAGMIGVGFLLLCMVIGLLWATRPAQQELPPATAALTVIVAPSATPIPPTPTPASATDTPSLEIPPAPANITLDAYVQIIGTGGAGLRLRSDPGLQGEIRFLALESEVFQVQDGPRQQDGYTWWFLVAPADQTIRGWAVANYLAVVQNP
jgi:hypothetical protein